MTNNSGETRQTSPRMQSINASVKEAAHQLKHQQTPQFERNSKEGGGSLLYLGNWQDPIPRLLILDNSLEGNDVRLWAYMRTLFTTPRASAIFPSYQDIQMDLPMAKATLAGCLATLRVTRWLTRCQTVRDNKGRFMGNIYALHEEPLALADTLILDAEYMEFLMSATQHSYRRVRSVAKTVLDTIREQTENNLNITSPVEQLEQINRRLRELRKPLLNGLEEQEALKDIGWNTVGRYTDTSSPYTRKLSTKDGQVQKLNSANCNQVQNLNSDNTQVQILNLGETTNLRATIGSSSSSSSSSFIYKNTTTTDTENNPRARAESQLPEGNNLVFPSQLRSNERPLIVLQLKNVQDEVRQDILDQLAAELANKKRAEPIHDPVCWVRGCCQRYMRGEFSLTSRALAVQEERRRQAAMQKREQAIAQEHARRLTEIQKKIIGEGGD